MKRRAMVGLGFGLVLLLGWFAAEASRPCDMYGGLSPLTITRTCRCAGYRYVAQDDAPVDGLTVTYCLGIVTSRQCTASGIQGITACPVGRAP